MFAGSFVSEWINVWETHFELLTYMNSKIDNLTINLFIYDALNYTNRRSTLPYGQTKTLLYKVLQQKYRGGYSI